jgi:hypothetical protein
MPDRDVFDRHVQRGWRTVGRLLLGAEVDPSVLQRVARHLAADLKRNGCPGFDQIAEILVDAIDSQQPKETARQIAIDRLDFVKKREGCTSTELVIRAANIVLAKETHDDPADVVNRDELRVSLASRVLAEIATNRMYPSPLVHELVEHERMSFQAMTSIQHRCKHMLQRPPELQSLAAQLLQDPEGCAVKLPRRRKTHRSQADLLVAAIS